MSGLAIAVTQFWGVALLDGSGAVTLDPDVAFAHPGAGDIVGCLHPHERVHLDAECLLEALSG